MSKISILTPFYNAETTLAKTIESVLAQDYEDWELILFNDHSTDLSRQIADGFVQGDNRIRLYENNTKIKGPSHGRNYCFSKSCGELIAFLDADDIWETNYLQARVVEFDQKKNIGMVYGPARYQYEHRSFVQETGFTKSQEFKKNELLITFISNTKATPCTGASMVRRSAFEDVNGFRTEIHRGEDIAFYMVLNSMHAIYYDSRPLFIYVRHENSATSRANKDESRLTLELEYFKWLYPFAKSLNQSKIVRAVEEGYYSHLVEMIKQKSFVAGRISLFKLLQESGIGFRESAFFILYCIFPISLAKRVKYRIKQVLYPV